jgi:hypothetical protein
VLALALIALLPAPAQAQSDRPTWGVTFSFVPQWKPASELAPLYYGVEDMDAEGHEFRIGAVRGRHHGGDWSVTFVRNKFKTGSVFDDSDIDDFGGGRFGESYVTHDDVAITGVRYEKFVSFLNIKNRAQVGMTFGAGYGKISGTVDKHEFSADYGFNPQTGQPTLIRQNEQVTTVDIEEVLDRTAVPLGNVEFAVAVMVAPGLKVRATGGFSFPNTQVFNLTVNYLFGR